MRILWRSFVIVCVVLTALSMESFGQVPTKAYKIKDGKQFILLPKNITQPSLDSFIAQYDLFDLNLRLFNKKGFADSLRKIGWRIELNDAEMCIISKPLLGAEDIFNPADKISINDKDKDWSSEFPVVSSSVKYGYNRFKNKYPFRVKDSVVTFFLRGFQNARRVMLSGSFVNWDPDKLTMTKTDSGWIYYVKLGPGKYWYKFVVDGSWTIDKDNELWENDGRGNDNSVYFKTNNTLTLNGYTNAKRVYLSGSFNLWRTRELLMQKTASGWVLPVYLAQGTHTYRFIADGRWFEDPGNPIKFVNEFNEYNSVIRIGKPYIFKLDDYKDAKQIYLFGSFNGWRTNELPMKKTATGWELPYTLGAGNYEYSFIIDNKIAKFAGNNGNLTFVIQPNYTFRLKAFPTAKNVFIAGDFNGWSPNAFPLKKEGDEWVATVHLDPGKHMYKYVVDGKWILDPGNKLWEQNEHNSGNSVIWIDKP